MDSNLYHYTNFDNALNILNSMNLRGYKINEQLKDRNELVFSGNKYHNIISKLIKLYLMKYHNFNKERLFYLNIMLFLLAKNKFADNSESKDTLQLFDKMQSNKIIEVVNDIVDKDINYYINCFSYKHDNYVLFNEYYNVNSGVILEFNSKYIDNSISLIKKVKYYTENKVEDFIKFHLYNFIENKNGLSLNDAMLFIREIWYNIITIKQESFSIENEIRIISQTDNNKYKNNRVFCDENRSYIYLFKNHDEFEQSLVSINLVNQNLHNKNIITKLINSAFKDLPINITDNNNE